MPRACDESPVNALEERSIRAMVAYAAHCQQVKEETVQAIVLAQFSVNDIVEIPSRSYDEVTRFLVDTQFDMVLN